MRRGTGKETGGHSSFSSTKKRRFRFETLEQRRLLAADLGIDLWSIAPPTKADPGLVSYITAAEARTLRLDEARIAELLGATERVEDVDRETARALNSQMVVDQQQWLVTLPSPDGGQASFRYETSAVMAPELAAEFPEIKTFRGQGIDDPAATVQFSVSPNGFFAQVLSPNGAWYIDPLYHNTGDKYAIYYGHDALPVPGNVPAELQIPELQDREQAEERSVPTDRGATGTTLSFDSQTGVKGGGQDGAGTILARSGTQLRTYRLAVAATGEYTAFHGGTVNSGLAAIVTAMTRVNGIYEQELAITMQLVANNDLLVFTNAFTDPYDNDNGIAMLSQNQTAIDQRIGNPSYDIGHVFSTGGGGVASLGSVGINSRKAQGVTGLFQPVGDPFTVDFVAHEMGHQYGGNHTFNGDSGNCSGGNRIGSTAFEPGSGSTIQAYAGICGNDNLQNNSDPQFHSISFDEMIFHVDSVIAGVGTRSNTGNSVPTVNAGINYTIPTGTPFTLTAVGSDANSGDVLTYSWEQRDLGPQSDVNAPDNGQSPLFRVFPPTTDPNRTFPRLSDLINNTTVVGETLPTVARPSMDFRVTVRDNRSGGGGVNTDDMVVTVVNTGSAFTVLEPNLATVDWPVQSTQNVRWNVAGTTGNGINAANVDIDLSIDGGLTYPISLFANTPNDGQASVVVPDFQSNNARVRVKGDGNIFFDISNANFVISPRQSTLDFGDAPNNLYGTLLANNGPRHTVGSLFLGTSVDTEVDGQPGVSALGDGIDEDGVRVLDPLVAGTTARLEVIASQAGVLNYFVDFDQTGGFGNVAGEAFTTNVVAGSQIISVAIPDGVSGESYMRFRISQAGGLSALGEAPTGEVEDYRIVLLTEAPGFDFGDAPFGSTLGSDGARHLVTGPVLGLENSEETVDKGNTTATGDDDDGIRFENLLLPGQTANVLVTSTGGELDYFVDFDRNGVFGNTTAEVFTIAVGAGTVEVPITVPSGTTPGVTFARFRLSIDGGLSATGLANDGEVEDYQIVIADLNTNPLTFQNFDASTNLPNGWTRTQSGAQGWFVTNQISFSAPNSVFANGVAIVSDQSLISPSIPVHVDGRTMQFMHDFILEDDFDGGVLEVSVNNGTFQDLLSIGGVFNTNGYNQTISGGFGSPIANRNAWSGDSLDWIQTRFTLPESMIGSDVRLRWRLATDSSFAVGRWLVDSIEILGGAVPLRDYGDAPASFPVLVADDGPSHLVNSTIRLGASVNTESNGQPSALANGDADNGIDLPDFALIGGELEIGVRSSNDRGILSAWFDFNDDGDWDDPGEQAIRDLAVGTGLQNVTIGIPSDAEVSAGIATRFRYSRQAGLGVAGDAADGEVEDYLITIAADDIVPPDIVAVYASGSAWITAFVDAADGGGQGAGNGIGFELGPGQLLPNAGINTLTIQFSEDIVGFDATSVQLLGVNVTNYDAQITVSYDPVTFQGTIDLDSALINDKLRLAVNQTVVDLAGNQLDGDGDMDAGGIFDLRFDVLVGDGNQDGTVTAGDLQGFIPSVGGTFPDAPYQINADWNSDATITGGDLQAFVGNSGQSLPGTEPASPNFGGSLRSGGIKSFSDAADEFFADLGRNAKMGPLRFEPFGR